MSTKPHPGQIVTSEGPTAKTAIIVTLIAFAVLFGSFYFFEDERFQDFGGLLAVLIIIGLGCSIPSPER